MRSKPIIRIKQGRKVYSTDTIDTVVFDQLDLTVQRGESVSIIGSSGAGKSTLLSVLGLIEPLTAGTVEIDGHDITNASLPELARIRNANIGFIFQSFRLIDSLSVLDNVMLPLSYRQDFNPREAKARAMGQLDTLGMTHRARHRPDQLSGGQQQRVAIARALVGDPGLLIADEPTGNLDAENSSTVMDLLTSSAKKGVAVCVVTHDEALAARMATRYRLENLVLSRRHSARNDLPKLVHAGPR